ncbi:MAG: hypothetical protein HY063_11615 [Bacteroidetes bacterium]|nr:hypothetical protein [Bacteroidota bacterium]
MFSRINIENELIKEKKKYSPLDEAYSIFNAEIKKEKEIYDRIFNPESSLSTISISSENIFTSDQIKNVAITYRLRFLDSKLFKGEIPYEAILHVKELEKKYQVKFSEFKILAPASLFKLEDRNKDPLLFAKVGENKFLFIYKWGNDLNAFRKIVAFPLRTIKNFILTFLTLSIFITILIPVDYPSRLFIFLLSNIFFSSTFAHIGYIRLNQNFSEFEWDSKFIS